MLESICAIIFVIVMMLLLEINYPLTNWQLKSKIFKQTYCKWFGHKLTVSGLGIKKTTTGESTRQSIAITVVHT